MPSLPHDEPFRLLGGSQTLEVVGEASYQESLWTIVGGRSSEYIRFPTTALLIPEPENSFDHNAIAVFVSSRKVGYLSRENAILYRPGILKLQAQLNARVALAGDVVGGGIRDDGIGFLGVFLRHARNDFGVQRPLSGRKAGVESIGTGLTEAIASDLDDDSYDLSWMGSLPIDRKKLVEHIFALLEAETDPIDRHFMFHHLEEALYALRETLPTALEQYDECCAAHDREMESIRDCFMTKWAKVPRLHTYKQMCIRLSKAKRYDEALVWAERGITIYGLSAARQDAVDDLRRRAASFKGKLDAGRSTGRSPTIVSSTPPIEALVCVSCGSTFERQRVAGRKPRLCGDCTAQG